MLKYILASAAAVIFAAGMGIAGQTDATGTTPGINPNSNNGKEIFTRNCTGCHGDDGKGHGPAVIEQKTPPIDLTVLSKNNHGRFPESHVLHILQFGAEVPSHTAVEMPVWGPILGKINQKDPRDKMVRIRSLSHYLETIQVE